MCRSANANARTRPLQALNLLNDPVFVESRQAPRVPHCQTARPTPADRLRLAFRLALGRDPDEKEAKTMESYLHQQTQIFTAHPKDAAALAAFAAGQRSQTDLAAWTAVASVLMNLDEFITRE